MDITGQPKYIKLLDECETSGEAFPYIDCDKTYQTEPCVLFKLQLPVKTDPVPITTNGDDIFIVSDFHMSSGKDVTGLYPGTENFFYDASFKRFIEFALKRKSAGKDAILIINGDIFDFLRVVEYPGFKKGLVNKIKNIADVKISAEETANKKNMYSEWIDELKKCNIPKTETQLEKSISRREKLYGLRTNDYKTIYKLMLIRKGHKEFFNSLAIWLLDGNSIVMVKGNHDVELYWIKVRNYIRLILAETIQNILYEKNKAIISIEAALRKYIFRKLRFIDDAVEFDKELYVEHGHRYEKVSMIIDGAQVEDNPEELNIPFGSLFNRYLVNQIELTYPYMDNIKPTTSIFPVLLKENLPLAMKVFLVHLPTTLLTVTKSWRNFNFMFRKLYFWVLLMLVPVIIYWSEILKFLFEKPYTNPSPLGSWLTNIAMLVAGYFLARILARFQITDGESLDKYARIRFANSNYRIITMGHTHTPASCSIGDDKFFFNTGTWIPIFENSTAEVRTDKTYTFLHLKKNMNNNYEIATGDCLQRWNDDALRSEDVIVINKYTYISSIRDFCKMVRDLLTGKSS